jgi:cysteine sulfinate desulfinase/cysteine desulfurase-like protein
MIYLDWNSTTPVLSELLEAMMPYLNKEGDGRTEVAKG